MPSFYSLSLLTLSRVLCVGEQRYQKSGLHALGSQQHPPLLFYSCLYNLQVKLFVNIRPIQFISVNIFGIFLKITRDMNLEFKKR